MQIGIMLEGQNGVNWDNWKQILALAEDMGFQSVFRSDHYTNAGGPHKDSLELWVSLTYAASHTQRIEFGPLVSPVTFRNPTMTARMAAQVDDLSGGRLVLGLGAGWQEREHTSFSIPFYDFPTRYAMLREALDITRLLFDSAEPFAYAGQHYTLSDALLLPRPQRAGGPPILIGGNGPKKTIPLAAEYATEWNAIMLTPQVYKERCDLLDGLMQQQGREPGDIKRSMMMPNIFARDDAELQTKIANTGKSLDELREQGRVVGTPAMWVDQLGALAEAGCERVMVQWLALDDLDGLEILARDVMPQVV